MVVEITPGACKLNEGTIEEMARYDGGYEEVERIGKCPDYYLGDIYRKVIVKGKRITVARWRSFGVKAEIIAN